MVRIGLYGNNGHQLPTDGGDRSWTDRGAVVAVAGFAAKDAAAARHYDTLDGMLADPDIDLVSLCSPRRADQAADAIRCMEAGKHVLAEKPCAFNEGDLDRIIQTAGRTGRVFHEMAPTIVEEPYATIAAVVREGRIGSVVQVYAQKSYPWTTSRPRDEAVDGGLLRQAGVYLYRFVEHIAGIRVVETAAYESRVGSHDSTSQCRRAASVIMRLENGGVASGVANYCTPAPPDWSRWGYETLRVFGEHGLVESINYGQVLRIVITEGGVSDIVPAAIPDPARSADQFLLHVLREIEGDEKPLMSIDAELHPTRMVNRAKAAAQ